MVLNFYPVTEVVSLLVITLLSSTLVSTTLKRLDSVARSSHSKGYIPILLLSSRKFFGSSMSYGYVTLACTLRRFAVSRNSSYFLSAFGTDLLRFFVTKDSSVVYLTPFRTLSNAYSVFDSGSNVIPSCFAAYPSMFERQS